MKRPHDGRTLPHARTLQCARARAHAAPALLRSCHAAVAHEPTRTPSARAPRAGRLRRRPPHTHKHTHTRARAHAPSASATCWISTSLQKSSRPQKSSVHHVAHPRGGSAPSGAPFGYAAAPPSSSASAAKEVAGAMWSGGGGGGEVRERLPASSAAVRGTSTCGRREIRLLLGGSENPPRIPNFAVPQLNNHALPARTGFSFRIVRL